MSTKLITISLLISIVLVVSNCGETTSDDEQDLGSYSRDMVLYDIFVDTDQISDKYIDTEYLEDISDLSKDEGFEDICESQETELFSDSGTETDIITDVEYIADTTDLNECLDKEDNSECNDENACTINDRCLNGQCVGEMVVCPSDNPCIQGSCDPTSGCIYTFKNGILCDDKNACTNEDTCSNGVCVGVPVNCDDNNECTKDLCDAKDGCINIPLNGIPCDDMSLCTKDDLCMNGKCVGTPIKCDDQNECTEDICDPEKGCVFIPLTDTPCEDDNKCTDNDVCKNGTCTSGKELICNDNEICTIDKCNPSIGCVYIPLNDTPCDDNNLCTKNDRCVNGECVGEERNCDDGNICTNDNCSPSIGCYYTYNNGIACDDSNKCTTDDKCTNGKCIGTPITCNDNNICTDDSCDPALGCIFINNNLPCNDMNICTTNDHCSNGACIGGPPINCDDGNVCTYDTCDPQSGCKYTYLNGIACDDKNSCTYNDKCLNGQCVGTPIPNCP